MTFSAGTNSVTHTNIYYGIDSYPSIQWGDHVSGGTYGGVTPAKGIVGRDLKAGMHAWGNFKSTPDGSWSQTMDYGSIAGPVVDSGYILEADIIKISIEMASRPTLTMSRSGNNITISYPAIPLPVFNLLTAVSNPNTQSSTGLGTLSWTNFPVTWTTNMANGIPASYNAIFPMPQDGAKARFFKAGL